MVLPSITVDYCMNMGKTSQQSWQIVGMMTGICGAAALLICALTIKLDDKKDFVKPPKKKKEPLYKILPTMMKGYWEILKLKPVRTIIGASLTYLIANITFSSDRVFFMKFNLGMGDKAISAMLMVITIAGVCSVPFITKLAVKLEKKKVFMYGIGICGVLMMASRFVGVEGKLGLVAVCLFYAFANACYWQLMPSMLYDVCEVEELISGEKHSGAVISLQALSESLSIAVGVQMLGIILEMSGFNSELSVQTELALTWVENAFAFIPGAAMVLMAVIISRYPVSKEVFSRVMDALNRRKSGEEVDIKEFEDIYVTGGKENLTKGVSSGFSVVVSKGDAGKIEKVTDVPEKLSAPIVKGEKIGTVTYILDGKSIGTSDILAAENVDKITFWSLLKKLGSWFLCSPPN